jgi:hypothetical protein
VFGIGTETAAKTRIQFKKLIGIGTNGHPTVEHQSQSPFVRTESQLEFIFRTRMRTGIRI